MLRTVHKHAQTHSAFWPGITVAAKVGDELWEQFHTHLDTRTHMKICATSIGHAMPIFTDVVLV